MESKYSHQTQCQKHSKWIRSKDHSTAFFPPPSELNRGKVGLGYISALGPSASRRIPADAPTPAALRGGDPRPSAELQVLQPRKDSHVQLKSSCAWCSTWAGRKEPLELLTACPEKRSRTGAWPWVFMVEMTLMLTQSCRAPRTVQTLWEHTHGCCALLQRVFSSDDAVYGLFHDSCQCNVIFHSNKT
ncbi:uncharacterized protein ACIBXB_011064 isoform 1-T1 [Morphnus guianensis]